MGKKLFVVKKNKLYVYEVKTSLKFYKIKEKILNTDKTHINGIYNFSFDKLGYYTDNEEVKIDDSYCFLTEKEIFTCGNSNQLFYKGYKYPDILNLALKLRDGDTSSIDKLNEYRAPFYIKNMKESKKKERLMKDYPYDKYVDDIISCFTLTKKSMMEFNNMEDLVKKIEIITKRDKINTDYELLDITKKAFVSMFIPDSYGDKSSGIYKLKEKLKEYNKIYDTLREMELRYV